MGVDIVFYSNPCLSAFVHKKLFHVIYSGSDTMPIKYLPMSTVQVYRYGFQNLLYSNEFNAIFYQKSLFLFYFLKTKKH